MNEAKIILPHPIDVDKAQLDSAAEIHSDLIEELTRAFNNCRATATVIFYLDKETNEFKVVDALEYCVICGATPENQALLQELSIKYKQRTNSAIVHLILAEGKASINSN
jgi:hypothetical protein